LFPLSKLFPSFGILHDNETGANPVSQVPYEILPSSLLGVPLKLPRRNCVASPPLIPRISYSPYSPRAHTPPPPNALAPTCCLARCLNYVNLLETSLSPSSSSSHMPPPYLVGPYLFSGQISVPSPCPSGCNPPPRLSLAINGLVDHLLPPFACSVISGRRVHLAVFQPFCPFLTSFVGRLPNLGLIKPH